MLKMENSTFLALLGLFSALELKIAPLPPSAFDMQNMFFLFGVQENSDAKGVPILGEDLFLFGLHLNSDTKTVSSAEENLFVLP